MERFGTVSAEYFSILVIGPKMSIIGPEISMIGPEISIIVSKTLGHPTDKYTINSFNRYIKPISATVTMSFIKAPLTVDVGVPLVVQYSPWYLLQFRT